MTVNVARRRPRTRAAGAPEAPPLAIGENNQTIFACPTCARPLALGSHRCPGCGTRLVLGVQLRRATVFAASGLFVGLLLGAGGLFAAITLDRLGHETDSGAQVAAAIQPGASAIPGVAATTTPTATATATSRPSPATPGVPALSRSALGQSVALNVRLRETGAALHTALVARTFDVVEVSGLLRTMSSDAVIGLGLTQHIGAWAGGTEASTGLGSFYGEVKATAAEGLAASIRNERAYRIAATRMVDLLAGLDAVDAVTRAAAADAGVVLPEASATP